MLQKLTKIGFRKVGEWYLEGECLSLELHEESQSKNILYSIVVDGEPKYVGKTVQTLKKRMHGYQRPAPTQSTNIRNSKLIIDALKRSCSVELFALPDNGLLHFGEFHLNLAAGLEDSVVCTLSPQWNFVGKHR